MRINKYLAAATGLSRRAVDTLIADGQVRLGQTVASLGDKVSPSDNVYLNNKLVEPHDKLLIMLNKPVGYVVSRAGQGSRTIDELLPEKYQMLKPVGRLDKDSSGLLLLTNDGDLAQKLTHPSSLKTKLYKVSLNKGLASGLPARLSETGVKLNDGLSSFDIGQLSKDRQDFLVTMTEGRNRQIRRTFQALGYEVKQLHRLQFAEYDLGSLQPGQYKIIS